MLGTNVAFYAFVAALITYAQASGFLQPVKDKRVARNVVEQTLMNALSMDAAILNKVKEDMQPIYAALPKTAENSLEKSTVHYALHRYFVQKHGWYVKGLLDSKEDEEPSSVSTVLRDRAPAYIQGLLEKHLSGHGWHLHALAVYAAALSELIRIEALTDLHSAHRMLSSELDESLDKSELEFTVLDGYLLLYVLEENTTFDTYEEMQEEVSSTWPGWSDFRLWAHDLHRDLQFAARARQNPFKQDTWFNNVAETVQHLGHAYGDFQNHECNALKEFLTSLEVQGTGRVSLSSFYEAGLGDEWRFWETPEYLRYLGSLDETRPDVPMVIIPNFLEGHNNCVASSSFVEVCCTNQCERIMSHLEKQLGAPSASPSRIAELVSSIPSESVDAPRNLSVSLSYRLDEIAARHNGQVPVHGRLFAQWMHHAYPLECPYPAVHGNKQLTTDEYEAKSGEKAILGYRAQHDKVRSLGKQMRLSDQDKSVELPWVAHEQLVDDKWEVPRPAGHGFLRPLMGVMALVSFAVPLTKASRSFCTSSKSKSEHHFV